MGLASGIDVDAGQGGVEGEGVEALALELDPAAFLDVLDGAVELEGHGARRSPRRARGPTSCPSP